MVYPLPKHLKKIFIVDKEETDSSNLIGKIRCTCGCEEFYIDTFSSYYGEDKCISFSEDVEGYSLLVRAECACCKKKWTIFDFSKHGFPGFVFGEGTAVNENEELIRYSCNKCNQKVFTIDVCIQPEDKEQFIDENVIVHPDKFSENDYVEAFDWIVISLDCKKCNHKNEDWLNLELS